MKERKYLIVHLSVFLFIAILISVKGTYNNKVIFTGDEWDYQSIGVNFYYGHDFLLTGPLEQLPLYKLEKLNKGKMTFWEHSKGKKAVYRSPLYPIFICGVYKFFGVNPVIVKYIQLLLLIVSGLLLILTAKLIWGSKGLMIGYWGFVTFMILNYRYPEHLMPETWQFLFLHLILIVLLLYYSGSVKYALILGIILGISVLNKGTTFFLFPIILIYDLYYIFKKKWYHIQKTALFILGFVLITGFWSIYIYQNQRSVIYISTQGSEVLLDGNNELCGDGLWHPEWRNNNSCFYNHDHKKDNPTIIRVINFYYTYPEYLKNILAKISNGILVLPSFLFSVGFLLTLLVVSFIHRIKIPVAIPVQFVIIFMNFVIFTIVFYVCNETYSARYVKTMDGVFILFGFYCFFEIIKIFKVKHQVHHDEK
jgi:4-amino-4-deoxy-L-arabinose transferase-like glycosyltransferase